VTVRLSQQGHFVQLAIHDDGIGFNPGRHPSSRGGGGSLGLLSMRERTTYAGGTLTVDSAGGAGTKITVRIPLGKTR
jgi:signal transduction histidine kinase